MGGWRAVLVVIVGLIAGLSIGTAAAQITPQTRTVSSLWYRGVPAGVPRQADLDAIHEAGFTAVTWPTQYVTGALELRRMADRSSLKVVIRSEPVPLTPASALRADTHVDIVVSRTAVALFPALAWRAVAHGARVISFDAGVAEGTGLRPAATQPAAWVAAASAVARQLAINATLVDTLIPGPAVRLDPPMDGLDVVLLDAPRSWVLVATNSSSAGTPPVDTYAFMPPGVPSAEWLNLFDGSTIGMSSRPTGARWHVVLGPGDTRVYVIDRVPGY